MHDEQHVVIFWDASACPASGVSGFDLARSIQTAAATLGQIKSFRFYVDVNGTSRASFSNFRSELKFAGVTVVDTVSEGREGSPAKMLLTDTFVYALDNPAPQTLLLVSRDPDIFYGVSLLRLRGYQVYLLSPSSSHRILSHFQLNLDFDDSLFGQDNRSPSPPKSPTNGREPAGHHSRSTGPLPPATKRPSSDSHRHLDESPNILAPSEIEEYRRRYSTSKPISLTDPFTPPQDGFRAGMPMWGAGPQIGGLRHAVQKGKEKAQASGSPFQSPSISPASSIPSRSNSWDSYIMPPSVSTAPTSALPLHHSGDLKLSSALRAPAASSAIASQQIERAVSASSSDSGGATIIAAHPVPSHGPPCIVKTGPSAPTAPAPPPAPERIQVRASLPFGTPNQTPIIPAQNPTVVSASQPLISTPPDPQSVVYAPQPKAQIIKTPLVASIASNAPTPPLVRPVISRTPSRATAPPGRAPASAPASSNPSSIPLDGVAPYFQHLIHVLRDLRSQGIESVDRGGNLLPLLQKRDRNILLAAGTAQYRNPFALYLEDAHEAGIITSPTGRVQLAARYR